MNVTDVDRTHYFFIILSVLLLSNAFEILNPESSDIEHGEIKKTPIIQDGHIVSYKNERIPNLGIRFTGKESDEYIVQITYFTLKFTEVRMIELPQGKEKFVMEGMQKANIRREDLFLSYKLNYTMVGIDDTRNEIEKLFKRSSLHYIDLFLIHFMDTQGFYVVTWKTMIDLKHQGKIRYLGVCNALNSYVTYLYRHTGILPSVIQLEINPYFQQSFMIEKYQELGIVVQAYSVMAGGYKMYEPRLQRIAKKYELTPAQLLIQWCLSKSLSCLVTSTKLYRIAENFHPVNIALTEEDIEQLDALEENVANHFDPYDTEHLQSVDSFIQSKMDKLQSEGYWNIKPLSSMKHVYLPEEYKEPENATEEDFESNSIENDTESISETMTPLYLSGDVNTEITPEVLEIIRQEEAKLKEQGLYDEFNGIKNEEKEKEFEEAKYTIKDETEIFKLKVEDIPSTCKRMTKESIEKALKEAEGMND